MATNFFRTFVNDRSFIRGAARLLSAPISQPMPAKISDVIALATVATPASDVQTITETGPPTAGGFFLSLDLTQAGDSNYTTALIPYNATNAAVQTAVQALPNVGAGNATATGGPLPTTPVVVTFAGTLANKFIPPMTVTPSGLTGGTVAVAHTTPGTPALALYDAQSGWTDLGATKNGITISVNNAEETFDIDQQLGIIGSQPSAWTVTVGTSLAESTPERLQVAWEGSDVIVDATPASGPEKEIGFGAPNFYIHRRIAVLYQRPNGLIRGYLFRDTVRSPQESTLTHNKTGDQQSIPVLFNVLADNTITDTQKQFFLIRDQSIT